MASHFRNVLRRNVWPQAAGRKPRASAGQLAQGQPALLAALNPSQQLREFRAEGLQGCVVTAAGRQQALQLTPALLPGGQLGVQVRQLARLLEAATTDLQGGSRGRWHGGLTAGSSSSGSSRS